MKLLPIAIIIVCILGCSDQTATNTEPYRKPDALYSESIVKELEEQVNNRTILLNKICPTRQKIKECKEWCKQVDCKE